MSCYELEAKTGAASIHAPRGGVESKADSMEVYFELVVSGSTAPDFTAGYGGLRTSCRVSERDLRSRHNLA